MRIFIGGDRYLPGVPARDLEDAEWNALTPELRETAESLELYKTGRRRTQTPAPELSETPEQSDQTPSSDDADPATEND